MNSATPLVSIVIPVYNGSNYLREAIDSALAQTWPNIEVIVVNDGSRDDGATERIALSYGDRIRYIAKENGGVATALNLGIREMKGDYFSWLSHDDLYYPDKVAANLEFLKACPEGTAIVYSDFEEIDSHGNLLRQCRLAGPPPEGLRVSFLFERAIHGCSLLVPKACFDRFGVFDEVLIISQDYDLWFRFAAEYQFVHQPAVLVKSRVHPTQGSRTIKSYHDEVEFFLSRCLGQLSREEVSRITPHDSCALGYLQLALRLVSARTPGVAREAFHKGCRLLPEEQSASRMAGRRLQLAYWLASAKLGCLIWAKRLKRRLCGESQ